MASASSTLRNGLVARMSSVAREETSRQSRKSAEIVASCMATLRSEKSSRRRRSSGASSARHVGHVDASCSHGWTQSQCAQWRAGHGIVTTCSSAAISVKQMGHAPSPQPPWPPHAGAHRPLTSATPIGTALARWMSFGSTRRTYAASRSRCTSSSRMSSRSDASAAARAARPPAESTTTPSGSSRKVRRLTDDGLIWSANSRASAASRDCMSLATFESASGWAETSKPRAELTSGWPIAARVSCVHQRDEASSSGALQRARRLLAVQEGTARICRRRHAWSLTVAGARLSTIPASGTRHLRFVRRQNHGADEPRSGRTCTSGTSPSSSPLRACSQPSGKWPSRGCTIVTMSPAPQAMPATSPGVFGTRSTRMRPRPSDGGAPYDVASSRQLEASASSSAHCFSVCDASASSL
mmetsp:Transcript_32089/g.84008  ORF Transcript_32089/g.84008 Transcript_32089/m.84008 type:complete len:413 (-) Transcript_32089:1060-2298(-)